MAQQHRAMDWRPMLLITSSAQGLEAGQPFSPAPES